MMKAVLNLLILCCWLSLQLVHANADDLYKYTQESTDYRTLFTNDEFNSTFYNFKEIDKTLFYKINDTNLNPSQMNDVLSYNLIVALKYMDDSKGKVFSEAANNITIIAERYNNPTASFALGTLIWLKGRSECKGGGGCRDILTIKAKKHFEIAALADESGGAAIEYSIYLSRNLADGWQEDSKYWGQLGRKKNNLSHSNKQRLDFLERNKRVILFD